MLPSRFRLSSSRDIARIYQKGRALRSDLFRLLWLPNRSQSARVAVVTSRKLSTKAVQRNLLKRQTRGILQGFVARLGAVDLVVQVLPSTISRASVKQRAAARAAIKPTLTYETLERDLATALRKAGLLAPLVKGEG